MAGKQKMEKGENPIPSAILLGIGLVVAAGSLRYGFGSFEDPGPGFLPFFSGAVMAAFAAAILIRDLRKRWSPLRDLWKGARWRLSAMVAVCVLLYTVFLRDLGFLISTFLLMAYFFRVLETSAWKKSLFAALATTVGFYLVFQVWLQAQLPKGPLGF
jgi:putative tricarboxylic transport membrane protein